MAEIATADAVLLVEGELRGAGDLLVRDRAEDLERLVQAIADADRVFVLGLGRSGLALRMTAMRLMHLGLTVHVVGETTAPAIGSADVLLTASGSGTTDGVVRLARRAAESGATVLTITADPASPLAEASSVVVPVSAAGKLDRSATRSQQYAGSLFEQTVVLIGDAVFHALWKASGQTADRLWPRHANLE